MAKIFISYKYADNQVHQELDKKYWAEETNELTGTVIKETKATGRAYVNYLEELIGRDHIYKGEKDDESLDGKNEEQIWEIIKPKVHDSTVTLIAISRGMKETGQENNQWMPHEIRYSLWEVERGDKTSSTNALLGVILPDQYGSYEYIYGKSSCPHCAHVNLIDKHNNPYLFSILKGNIFNRKSGNGQKCLNGLCSTLIYNDGHSYLHLVTLEEFIKDHQTHIDKALKIKDNCDLYSIEKTI